MRLFFSAYIAKPHIITCKVTKKNANNSILG